MHVNILLILIFIFMTTSESWAASTWKQVLIDKKENIKVYYRHTDDGHIEFKGITYIKSSLNSFIAVFRDVETIPKWVDRTEKVELLKTVSDRDYYVYTVTSAPFPLKDRDGIVRTVTSQDPLTLSVTVSGTSFPDYLPKKKKYVRIKIIESSWKLTPKKNGMVETVFRGYADPGGKIPSWLFRTLSKKILKKSPHKTLKQLKKIIKLEKYQKKTYPFIREPDESTL